MVQEHFSSLTVGSLTGMASIAVPDGLVSWSAKVGTAILVALITGLVHGWAKRWAHGKKSSTEKGDKS